MIDWCWRWREQQERGEGEGNELLIALIKGKSLILYRFVDQQQEAASNLPLTNLEHFIPLAEVEASWTFTDSAPLQISFASAENLIVRTGKSLEIFGCPIGEGSLAVKHQSSVEIKCSKMFTAGARGIGLVLLDDSGTSASLYHCSTKKLLKLPLPGSFRLPLQSALIGKYICLAVLEKGVLVFDALNGELLSQRSVPGWKGLVGCQLQAAVSSSSSELKELLVYFDDEDDENVERYKRLHVLRFVAPAGVDQLQSASLPHRKRSPLLNSAPSDLRQQIADWRAETQEDERVDTLRRKFNLEEMSEEQMLQLAISMSGGEGHNSTPTSSTSDIDTDTEIAMRLSLQEM